MCTKNFTPSCRTSSGHTPLTKTGIPNLNNTYNVKDLIGSNGLLDITVSPNMPYVVLNVTSSRTAPTVSYPTSID